MKNILLFCSLFFSVLSYAQTTGDIKGVVTDEAMNSEPMLLANIRLKGLETEYQTNFHGNFNISNIEAGEYTLVISYAGYETKELNVVVAENKTSQIATNLNPLQISFDDVIGMEDTALEEKPLR